MMPPTVFSSTMVDGFCKRLGSRTANTSHVTATKESSSLISRRFTDFKNLIFTARRFPVPLSGVKIDWQQLAHKLKLSKPRESSTVAYPAPRGAGQLEWLWTHAQWITGRRSEVVNYLVLLYLAGYFFYYYLLLWLPAFGHKYQYFLFLALEK